MSSLHRLLRKATYLLLICWSLNSIAADRPVRILSLDWSSQIVLSHVYGLLLQQKGYNIEYISRDSDSQWFMLSSGKADLQVEIWEGTMAKRFDDLINRKLLQDGGEHAAKTREEWWYPQYVEELCPGLPDWQALNKCAQIFAGSDSKRGIYYTGPWEKPDRARIRALKMDFDVVNLKNGDELNQKLTAAISEKKPVVLFNWTPNWVESVYPGKFVEFPPYDPQCELLPEWGLNKDLIWDCGNPTNGWLKKAVSNELTTQFPCAFKLISQINLNNQQIADAAAFMDVDKLSASQAAQRWLDTHQADVENWLTNTQCSATDDSQQ